MSKPGKSLQYLVATVSAALLAILVQLGPGWVAGDSPSADQVHDSDKSGEVDNSPTQENSGTETQSEGTNLNQSALSSRINTENPEEGSAEFRRKAADIIAWHESNQNDGASVNKKAPPKTSHHPRLQELQKRLKTLKSVQSQEGQEAK